MNEEKAFTTKYLITSDFADLPEPKVIINTRYSLTSMWSHFKPTRTSSKGFKQFFETFRPTKCHSVIRSKLP